MTPGTTRICAGCGTANPMTTGRCLACRRPLDGGATIASAGRHEQPTYVVHTPAYDQQDYAVYSSMQESDVPPPRRGGRTGGCVMGLLAFGVICALTAVLAALLIGRPLLENAVGDELEQVVANEVIRALDASANATGVAPGTYVIRAEEINAELAANADRYAPIENATVTIDPTGLAIHFEVYNVEGTYRGGIEVVRGQVVLTDLEADGTAARILPADEVEQILEGELNDYFARNDLSVVQVELGEGVLTVITSAAIGTPTVLAPRSSRTPTAESDDEPTPAATSTPAPGRTPTPPAGEEAAGPTATRRLIDFLRTPTPE